jgi:hypothetical protein
LNEDFTALLLNFDKNEPFSIKNRLLKETYFRFQSFLNTFGFMKLKLVLLVCIGFFFYACVKDLNNRQAEVLFDSVEEAQNESNDSVTDTLKKAFENFDVNSLDSAHQKAFWFNAYSFYVDHYRKNKSNYLDRKTFGKEQFVIAKDTVTLAELMEKLSGYNDPRLMICIDFLTVNSTPSIHEILNKDLDAKLEELCTKYINNPDFIRVKKDIKQVYYPQHFDWQLQNIDSTISAKELIIKYHSNNSIANFRFKPYPFSFKVRTEDKTFL